MTAAIEIKGLQFKYPDGYSMRLRELAIDPGAQAVLCGPSGCGKSTLLNLIAGLLDPEAGSIRIGGESITDAGEAARDGIRGRRIGMVFQTHHLLVGFTALENLEVAMLFSDVPRVEHRNRAQNLLAKLGLERIDTPIERLSVGQQQRVAIARALAARPSIVLADEPTASLDPPRAQEAMQLLREAARDQEAALLVSSHDPLVAHEFERVIDFKELVDTGGEE